MRIIHKKPPEPGDTRIRTFYAWWPVRCRYETRWLEPVIVKQMRYDGKRRDYWYNCEFLEKLS